MCQDRAALEIILQIILVCRSPALICFLPLTFALPQESLTLVYHPPSPWRSPSMTSLPYETSASSFSEKTDVEKKDGSIVSENDGTKPAWQRILTGDAKEGYDTKRALQTRHIMMIGAHPSARPHAAPLTFPSQLLVVQ